MVSIKVNFTHFNEPMGNIIWNSGDTWWAEAKLMSGITNYTMKGHLVE